MMYIDPVNYQPDKQISDVFMKLLITVSLLLLFPALTSAQDMLSQLESVTLTINHDDGGKLSERHMKNLLDALSEAGCKSVLAEASDAPTQLVFDPHPVSVVIKKMPDYRLIARARTLDGKLQVRGAILVHASRGITDLSSLKNEWISFVSKESWSAYRLPLQLLRQAGIDETSNPFFFIGNHIGVVGALLHRDVHVAVTAEPLARQWAEQNGLSIVAVTDEVETGGWWLHRSVPEKLTQNCSRAVMGLDGTRYKTLPAWIGSFVAP